LLVALQDAKLAAAFLEHALDDRHDETSASSITSVGERHFGLTIQNSVRCRRVFDFRAKRRSKR
jgi:hypothetical protein